MRKTYIVDISNLKETWKRFEKRTKYEITKFNKSGKKVVADNFLDKLDYFHRISRPDRKIDFEYIKRVFLERNCVIYRTETAAAMFEVKDDTVYYLLAGRDKTQNDGAPSAILWKAMQDFNEQGVKQMDLCGANKPNTSLFKRGFGGKLVEQEKTCLQY